MALSFLFCPIDFSGLVSWICLRLRSFDHTSWLFYLYICPNILLSQPCSPSLKFVFLLDLVCLWCFPLSFFFLFYLSNWFFFSFPEFVFNSLSESELSCWISPSWTPFLTSLLNYVGNILEWVILNWIPYFIRLLESSPWSLIVWKVGIWNLFIWHF